MEKRLSDVEDKAQLTELGVAQLDVKVTNMAGDVSEIKEKVDRRPSWSVTIYMTAASSLAAGLLGHALGVGIH